MIPDKDTRDIQAYSKGLLPRIRREKFEERLQSDAEFKAKYEELNPILQALEDIDVEEKLKTIITRKKENEREIVSLTEEKKDNYLPIQKIISYGLAASIMVLIGIFWHDSTMNSRAYSKFYEPENSVVRGNEITNCPDKATLELYYQRNYKALLDNLEKQPSAPCNEYYKALCYLEMKDFPKAILSFKEATKTSELPTKQRAEWYLGLAFLKNDEPEKAKEMMVKIMNTPEHQYETLAKDLVEELNKKPILF